MKTCIRTSILIAMGCLLALPVAADPVLVTANGQVEYNLVSAPPLGDANPGDPVTVTFEVDSNVFTDSINFPVRGYEINAMSFVFEAGAATLELQDPFPVGQTPWFVIRDNDPAVDGFFLSAATIDFPLGVPLNQTGFFGQFTSQFLATYVGDTLSSLDILGALGTYDFTGLTVFNFTVDDGPFQAVGVVFESLTLELTVIDADGDGVPDDQDLCPDTVIPESVPARHLGVNRWALVDNDLVFDTVTPPGGGPGFEFDTADTGGCSCEQIIVAEQLGSGHTFFGCSNSAILYWVDGVAGSGYMPEESGAGPRTQIESQDVPTDGVRQIQRRTGETADGSTATGGDRFGGNTTETPFRSPDRSSSKRGR